MKICFYNTFYGFTSPNIFVNFWHHLAVYSWRGTPTPGTIQSLLSNLDCDFVGLAEVMTNQISIYHRRADQHWYDIYKTKWEKLWYNFNRSHCIVLCKQSLWLHRNDWTITTSTTSWWGSWGIWISKWDLHILVLHLSNKNRWHSNSLLLDQQLSEIIALAQWFNSSDRIVIMWDLNLTMKEVSKKLLSWLDWYTYSLWDSPTRQVWVWPCIFKEKLDYIITKNISLWNVYHTWSYSDHYIVWWVLETNLNTQHLTLNSIN